MCENTGNSARSRTARPYRNDAQRCPTYNSIQIPLGHPLHTGPAQNNEQKNAQQALGAARRGSGRAEGIARQRRIACHRTMERARKSEAGSTQHDRSHGYCPNTAARLARPRPTYGESDIIGCWVDANASAKNGPRNSEGSSRWRLTWSGWERFSGVPAREHDRRNPAPNIGMIPDPSDNRLRPASYSADDAQQRAHCPRHVRHSDIPGKQHHTTWEQRQRKVARAVPTRVA
ncbi:hypothetical protein HYPSUDRAFT_206547 [Hypholoma sublateritium FD-334 SS-4]|uniref:Uncharacterized protein n=1 Tax=Hypholoma sublateritium (strain FD-334 SS-4) TaxID=945553 RepID=A0A0D2M1C7_HYPSF|nr:hypothetical protein HYPSUDRAFT_206547 [Hypholoma sublateritium FD-334 SS-4]